MPFQGNKNRLARGATSDLRRICNGQRRTCIGGLSSRRNDPKEESCPSADPRRGCASFARTRRGPALAAQLLSSLSHNAPHRKWSRHDAILPAGLGLSTAQSSNGSLLHTAWRGRTFGTTRPMPIFLKPWTPIASLGHSLKGATRLSLFSSLEASRGTFQVRTAMRIVVL